MNKQDISALIDRLDAIATKVIAASKPKMNADGEAKKPTQKAKDKDYQKQVLSHNIKSASGQVRQDESQEKYILDLNIKATNQEILNKRKTTEQTNKIKLSTAKEQASLEIKTANKSAKQKQAIEDYEAKININAWRADDVAREKENSIALAAQNKLAKDTAKSNEISIRKQKSDDDKLAKNNETSLRRQKSEDDKLAKDATKNSESAFKRQKSEDEKAAKDTAKNNESAFKKQKAEDDKSNKIRLAAESKTLKEKEKASKDSNKESQKVDSQVSADKLKTSNFISTMALGAATGAIMGAFQYGAIGNASSLAISRSGTVGLPENLADMMNSQRETAYSSLGGVVGGIAGGLAGLALSGGNPYIAYGSAMAGASIGKGGGSFLSGSKNTAVDKEIARQKYQEINEAIGINTGTGGGSAIARLNERRSFGLPSQLRNSTMNPAILDLITGQHLKDAADIAAYDQEGALSGGDYDSLVKSKGNYQRNTGGSYTATKEMFAQARDAAQRKGLNLPDLIDRITQYSAQGYSGGAAVSKGTRDLLGGDAFANASMSKSSRDMGELMATQAASKALFGFDITDTTGKYTAQKNKLISGRNKYIDNPNKTSALSDPFQRNGFIAQFLSPQDMYYTSGNINRADNTAGAPYKASQLEKAIQLENATFTSAVMNVYPQMINFLPSPTGDLDHILSRFTGH